MKSTPLRTLLVLAAWAASIGVSLVLIVTSIRLAAEDPANWASFGPFASAIAIVGAMTASAGMVLRLRVPANRIGTLMAIGGPMLPGSFLGWIVLFERGATLGPDDPVTALVQFWSVTMLPIAIVVGYTGVGIVFPDGRLPGPRWRLPVVAIAAALLVSTALYAVSPWPIDGIEVHNPLALPFLTEEAAVLATTIASMTLIASFLVATLAAVTRWRRADDVERAQLKWFVASLVVALITFPLSWFTIIAGDLVDLLSVISAGTIPLAIGIAVTRYRLYDIDRLISRTIGWAVISGLIVGVFVVGLIGLQTLLEGVTQGQTFAVAASTLAAFALFQPLRRRVQRAVDRRFDRARYDGEQTAAAFADRLREQVDLAGLEADIAATASAALRPSAVSVWRRSPGGGR